MYKIPANTLFIGQKLIYVPECHSTNSSLVELLAHADLPEGAALATDHQTKGRGQRGNSWESGRGDNLTFSILLNPKFVSTRDQFQLSMAVSLGVASALQGLVIEPLFVKWPNDIMIGDKKVGGILIENQSQGPQLTASVVGIGINVNQRLFELSSACSLIQFTKAPMDLNDVYQRIIEGVEARYIQLRSGDVATIRKDYLNNLYRYNVSQSFESEGQRFVGMITDIDESGRLCVNVGNEKRTFALKEIRMVEAGY